MLVKQHNESTEEWIGKFRISAAECNCKDRQLKEQFIYVLNDNGMMVEIIRELTKGKNEDVTSNQGLLCVRPVECQRINSSYG